MKPPDHVLLASRDRRQARVFAPFGVVVSHPLEELEVAEGGSLVENFLREGDLE
jgi:hypothetical protein